VDKSRKVQLTWAGGLKSALKVRFCTLCGKRAAAGSRRLTRRSDNYGLKKRLNKAALRNRLSARVCSTGGQDK
jgi:hypothetical protein